MKRAGILLAFLLACGTTSLFGAEPVTVKHTPKAPRSGEKVVVSLGQAAAIQDPALEYQIVLPGNYVALKDSAYARGWTSVPMQKAGDGFTAEIPAGVQTHRALIRYRIRGRNAGQAMELPPPEDTQHNYAYFVYDGIPGWKAALDPASDESQKRAMVQFTPEVMNQVQSYFLIAKIKEVENATWYQQARGKEYRYTGTFVADGKVYDHVPFRARGGDWRFAMGKNMWKFNFNKGHHLEAKDDYGERHRSKWGKLNLRSCIQQGDYGRRGEQGMYEAVGFRLFNLAGVDAPRTHWVTLRIVGEKEESPANQYRGDFWGLYLAIENEDDDFLQDHNLPEGNIYKMMFGQGELSNGSSDKPTRGADLQRFLSGLHQRQSETWWRQNVDLPRYYSYRSIVEAIHHYDISAGKNYDFYFPANDPKCRVIPWDIDLTWGDHMYGGGRDPFYPALAQPAIKLEYQNRLREIRDLLYNPSETGRLIDECAALIYRPGTQSIVDADRFKWDYHPIMSSRYAMRGKADTGLFYQAARTRDFPGMVAQMKDYVVRRAAYIDRSLIADAAIPSTPSIKYSGSPGYPVNHLNFKTSGLADPTFGAMEWRIGQIDRAAKPKQRGHYEITPIWQSAEVTKFAEEMAVPPDALKAGNVYRARCRMKDATGRWSHWSEPVEFTAGAQN
jgi:hypothetical protein